MRILIAAFFASLLVIPQAGEARRGGGGGHGGGGHGAGTVGFFNAGNFGFLQPNFSPMVRPGFSRSPFVRPFARHQPLRFANRNVPFRDNRFVNNQFDGRIGNRFIGDRNRFDTQQWSGWGWWPVGGWSDGGYSGYTQATAAQPATDSQVIVLSDASPTQQVAVIAPGDYSYAGCHPIPNGYRCGQ